MSRAIASSILRKFSACRSSRVESRDLAELGDAVDEERDLLAEQLAELLDGRAGVLDAVVQQARRRRLATSSLSSAMIRATASGCMTYGSPDLRVWPSCACAANSYARRTIVEVCGGVVPGDLRQDLVELVHC